MKSCKEVTRILSSDDKMSLMTRLEIKMHLFMCKHCNNYYKQLMIIKDSCKQFFSKITFVNKDKVRELENKILKNLKKNEDK